MRQERTVLASIFNLFAEHEIGRELKAMSQWLDEHRDLLGLVTRDLSWPGSRSRPASEPVRPHADIIVKGSRDVDYGHNSI